MSCISRIFKRAVSGRRLGAVRQHTGFKSQLNDLESQLMASFQSCRDAGTDMLHSAPDMAEQLGTLGFQPDAIILQS